MSKLYFKYGAMGSSKTASALMCRFNYIQKGMDVLLLKPKIDTRFSQNEIVSRIGLKAECYAFSESEDLLKLYKKENLHKKIDVIIVDECQFCKKKQIEQLRTIAEEIPVLCYGLMTNFKTELFEGSKRLIELADSISEIKSVCECGRKAIINVRYCHDVLCLEGNEVDLGADEKYKGLCYGCYNKELRKANIYNRIVKYLKIFKNKNDAGHWSSDTAMDNVILQRPFVIYDQDVKNFLNDFKEFEVKNPKDYLTEKELENIKEIKLKNKTFDQMIAVISHVLCVEKKQPGLLKALIEEDIMTKWLRAIKKLADHEEE